MIVSCPECEQNASDRAKACPHCGFPLAEHIEEKRRQEMLVRDRATRARVGEVDCPQCEARGFETLEDVDANGKTVDLFAWCLVCEHTGRVELCKSERGYFAVARRELDAFLAGSRDDGGERVVFLGAESPPTHKYPTTGNRVVDSDE